MTTPLKTAVEVTLRAREGDRRALHAARALVVTAPNSGGHVHVIVGGTATTWRSGACDEVKSERKAGTYGEIATHLMLAKLCDVTLCRGGSLKAAFNGRRATVFTRPDRKGWCFVLVDRDILLWRSHRWTASSRVR
jgi:hypothetical protein